MIYFFRFDNINNIPYDKWLYESPDERHNVVLSHKSHSARLQSLCAFRLLCYALGFTPECFSYSEHGKPFIEGCLLHFNMSHTRGGVAVGIGSSPIGVDAERIRKHPQRVCSRVFTERENNYINCSDNPDAAFFKLWTLKESYIKVLGRGFSFPPINVEFGFNGDNIKCSDDGYSFVTHTCANYQVSACTVTAEDLVMREIELEELW